MNLVTLLQKQARERPGAAALIEGTGRRRRALSFAELETRTGQSADRLRSAGIGRGDRVLFLHPVSIDLYVAMISVMRLGAVAVFADPATGREGLRAAAERVACRGFFGSGKAHLLRLAEPSLRRIPVALCPAWWLPFAKRWPGSGAAGPGPGSGIEPVENDAPALITFTSGSTGLPKIVARSHGFLLAQNESLRTTLDLQPGETDLVTLPVFALANLAAGLTSVLADTDLAKPGAASAAAIGSQIVREAATRVTASPAFFARLLDGGADLSRVEKIHTGGGPVFPPLLEGLRAASAPGARVEAVYGSTEAEPIAHLAVQEIGEADLQAMRSGRGLLAGRPVPGTDVAILPLRPGEPFPAMSRERFDALRLPAGEAGEIVVSGPQVLPGYLDGVGDEETKIPMLGSDRIWHRTGDAGHFDRTGRLWLLGRCGAVIREDGDDLFPFAVETALSFHESVSRSALLELPRGEKRGTGSERVLAVVLARDAPEERTLAAIRESLSWAGIDRIETLPGIPLDRRHNAKVDYPALRRLLLGKGRPSPSPPPPRQ